MRSEKSLLVTIAIVVYTSTNYLAHSSLVRYKLLQEETNYRTGSSKRLVLELEKNLNELKKDDSDGNLWVVLAAGSSGWYNYRHQADVCHAYQIVRSHGVPDERIVVFMKDDIAYNQDNVNQGVIINKPNGTNVYKGVPKDYTGKNLNATIFLDVLSGKDIKVGSRKTLKTGANDRIFVYFADHGGPGISEFGEGMLYAINLTSTIEQMWENNQYKEMVLYWESCHSGSMFQNFLPDDINVYALSASSPNESSYACYLDEKIHNYLGDCFSVHWMEDADIENLRDETLFIQYLITKYETNTSQVEQWGSVLKMDREKMATYLGSRNTGGQKYFDTSMIKLKQHKNMRPVQQADVALEILKTKMENTNDIQEMTKIENDLYALQSNRKIMTETIQQIISSAMEIEHTSLDIQNSSQKLILSEFATRQASRSDLVNCFYPIVNLFSDNCFELTCNDYAIYQLKEFLPLCKAGITLESLRKSIDVHCKFENPICGIY